MSTFCKFKELPAELQNQIWQYAIDNEPGRFVHLNLAHDSINGDVTWQSILSSPAPISALLHAHRDSRSIASKRWTFLESHHPWVKGGVFFDSDSDTIHIDFDFDFIHRDGVTTYNFFDALCKVFPPKEYLRFQSVACEDYDFRVLNLLHTTDQTLLALNLLQLKCLITVNTSEDLTGHNDPRYYPPWNRGCLECKDNEKKKRYREAVLPQFAWKVPRLPILGGIRNNLLIKPSTWRGPIPPTAFTVFERTSMPWQGPAAYVSQDLDSDSALRRLFRRPIPASQRPPLELLNCPPTPSERPFVDCSRAHEYVFDVTQTYSR